MRDTTKAIERIRIEICKLWEAIADINKHQSQVEPHAEPKPEPAKEQFDVGDWVEFIDAGGRKSQGKYLSNTDGNAIIVLDTTCNMRVVVHMTKIIRKLKPSEVVLDFGRGIKGTVRSCEHDGGCVRVISGDRVIAHIMIDVLEQPTRNLVRQLLKAQEQNNG